MVRSIFCGSLLSVVLCFCASAVWAQGDGGYESCKFVKDTFANAPFEKELSPAAIRKIWNKKLALEKTPTQNYHTDDIDTLYHYQYQRSSVVFYKGKESVYFTEATIMDRGMKLKKGIEIGDSRADVMKKLKLPADIPCDTFTLTNEEDLPKHTFYFENDILVKVELNLGID